MSMDFLAYWPIFLRGAGVTVMLSCLSLGLGLVVGLLVALLRMSRILPLRLLALAYTEFFRSLPTLVVLFFSYYGLAFFLGINISPFAAATIALTLLSSAMMSEVIRAAIESVGAGQWQAARAAGMHPFQVFYYIIAPQAVRVMVAPSVGVYILTLKESSMAAIVGYVELMKGGLLVRDATGDSGGPLLVVAALYFIINYSISVGGQWIEKRFRILA